MESKGVLEGDLRVGAATMHWRKCGSGPALVFLHGFPLSGRTWDKVVAELSADYACHTPDLIGFGRSHSTVESDYSSQGQAQALKALLTELEVGPYAVIGNDSGGWIARELALIDQPRVRQLILTNTEIPGHRPPWIPLYQQFAELPALAAPAMRKLLGLAVFRRSAMGFGGCFSDLALLDGEFHQRYVTPLLQSPAALDEALTFLRQMKFSRLDEFKTLHAQLQLPTLFAWGENDPTFPVAQARAMLEQFPQMAGFHTLAPAKLFVHEEQPLALARLIRGFVRQA